MPTGRSQLQEGGRSAGTPGLLLQYAKGFPSHPGQCFHAQLGAGPLPQGLGEQGFHISKPPPCILRGVFTKMRRAESRLPSKPEPGPACRCRVLGGRGSGVKPRLGPKAV